MQSKSKRKRTQTDSENPFWTEADFRRARPARDFLVEQFGRAQAKRMLRPRGRPRTGAARTSISLRIPPEVLARWKATGPGWQTRMVEVLAKAKRS
jgi:uncharacterized protein (DUF4415 family)